MSRSEDWFYTDRNAPTAISETREFLLNGLNQTLRNTVTRKQVTFQSYACRDYFDNTFSWNVHKNKCNSMDFITTYQRDYGESPVPIKCDKVNTKEVHVDATFNRRPKNQFTLLPSAPTKFMDDALFNINEERKKIDFFRQLRNVSYLE